MRPIARTAVVVTLFLGLTGCPRAVPLDFGVNGEPKSVDDVLTRVDMAELSITSLKGDARLKVKLDDKGGSTGVFVAVADPAFIHLEILDFFGRPQSVLSTDGRVFGLYDGQQNRFFRGPATAENLGRALPVTMPPPQLAALLLGRVPRLEGAKAEMIFDREHGVFVVTLTRDDAQQRLEVAPPSYRVIKSAITAEQGYSVAFSELDQVGAYVLARHAVLEAPGTHLELSYKDVELNVKPDPALFAPAAPENVPQVELDGSGHEIR